MWDMSIMLYLIPISVIPLSGAHCNYQVKAGLVSDNLTSYLVKAGLVSNNLNSYLVKAAANLLSDVRLIPSIIPSVRGSMSRQTSLEATSQEMNLEKTFYHQKWFDNSIWGSASRSKFNCLNLY